MDNNTVLADKVSSGVIAACTEQGVLLCGNKEYCMIPYEETCISDSINYDKLIGKCMYYSVVDRLSDSIQIGSTRKALNAILAARTQRSINEIVVGECYSCIISGISTDGLIIDFGGIEGFLSKASIGFPKNASLAFMLNIGDEIEVKVEGVDNDNNTVEVNLFNIDPSSDDRAHRIEDVSEEEASNYVANEKKTNSKASNTPADIHNSYPCKNCCCFYKGEAFLADVEFNYSQRYISVIRDENNPDNNLFFDYRDMRFSATTDSRLLSISVGDFTLFCLNNLISFGKGESARLLFFNGLGTQLYNDIVLKMKFADAAFGKLLPFPQREKCLVPFCIDNAIRSRYGINIIQPYHQINSSEIPVEYTPTIEISGVEVEVYSFYDQLIFKGLVNLSCELESADRLRKQIMRHVELGLERDKTKPAVFQTDVETLIETDDTQTIHPDYDCIIEEFGDESCFLHDSFLILRKGAAFVNNMYGSPEQMSLYFYQNEKHQGGFVFRFRSLPEYYSFADYYRMVCALYQRVKQNVQTDYSLRRLSKKNNTDSSYKTKAEIPAKNITGTGEATNANVNIHSGIESERDDPFVELNNLIGLDGIKSDVRSLVNYVKIQKMREAKGLKSIPVSLHLVFTGNPGTGKTTIARILAQIYKDIGILKTGQLIEVDRSGLVAGYVGQTAIKTQEKIDEAIGGILFIDEAYTLAKEGNDFGQEAIDTLLKAMEDRRGEFIVIVAGYEEPMERFINSNPGLKSRFNKYFKFPDYSAEELVQIFDLLCKGYDYCITDDAHRIVVTAIDTIVNCKSDNFANAREIRNLFERIITTQADRVALSNIADEKDLLLITSADVK